MKDKNTNFGGVCKEKFGKVQEAFKKNFADGWEHEGAAFAVYHNNELVVDIWGGYADASSGRLWTKHTMTTCFSSTKSMCALSAAKLVDQKHMNYDDLVTKHWPEFGKNGKENVTVRQLVSHQAGLVILDIDLTLEHFQDHEKMSKVFEDQKPNWPLDDGMGYHMTTYGCLVSQLVRRCDTKHRSLGKYFQEEIMQNTGPESFYIGVPPDQEYRVARLSDAGRKDTIGQLVKYSELRGLAYKFVTASNPLMKKAVTQPKFLKDSAGTGKIIFNNPEYRLIEWGAATGVGTARGLAQPMNGLCQGKVLSQETLDQISKPFMLQKLDKVVGVTSDWGYGFHYKPSTTNPDQWVFGHPGFGGQNVKVDLGNGLAWAYITNGLKPFALGDLNRTYERLQNAMYDCL